MSSMRTRSQARLTVGISDTQVFRATKRRHGSTETKASKKRSPVKHEPIDISHQALDAPADVGPVELTTVPAAVAAASAATKTEPFSYPAALAYLYGRDPNLRALVEGTGKPCKVFERPEPAAGDRKGGLDAFKALATAIIYQQLSGKAAAAIRRKWLLAFPDSRADSDENWFPTPQQVRAQDVPTGRAAGLSYRKAEYLHALADKFIDGSITSDSLQEMDDAKISEVLTSVKGIGQWTVDMFLMFDLKRPNILPVGDLGVRKAMSIYFKMKGSNKGKSKGVYLPTANEMIEAAKIWEPYRTIGSLAMWAQLDVKTVVDT
ncbi:3-methyladenine DNA glycosylase [Geranomyces michiganensis]|nr:3-methyladenine DNA glycosylase [Geranomyces michiganensis]